jgi:uncharacterized protein
VDLQKTFEYFKKSADQGNEKAQFNLGICYEKGERVEVNLEKVFKFYLKYINQGHPNAQRNVAKYF